MAIQGVHEKLQQSGKSALGPPCVVRCKERDKRPEINVWDAKERIPLKGGQNVMICHSHPKDRPPPIIYMLNIHFLTKNGMLSHSKYFNITLFRLLCKIHFYHRFIKLLALDLIFHRSQSTADLTKWNVPHFTPEFHFRIKISITVDSEIQNSFR